MHILQRLIPLALVAALLSGCVVRPLWWGHGHYQGGGYGDRYRDGRDGPRPGPPPGRRY